MKQAAETLVKKTNEAMEMMVKDTMNVDAMMRMDETNLRLIKTTLELIEATNRYVIKSAELIEDIDRKTNELLQRYKGV